MKNLLTLCALSLSLVLSVSKASAEVVISTNTNISTLNPSTFNGTLRITNGATLTIDAETNWISEAPITVIVENNARIAWGGNHTWTLPDSSGIKLISGGLLSTANPCNANWMIVIGPYNISSCSGGNGVFSFQQLNAAGGTPTVTPSLSTHYLCAPGNLVATGNPSGNLADVNITYQWTGTGPGPFTFTSPTTVNTQITAITVPGVYTFKLLLTATHGSKIYRYASKVTSTLYVPPLNQSVFPVSTTTCRGANNEIKVASSQTGVTYSLYNNTDTNTVLQSAIGTGSSLAYTIPFVPTVETYIVKAKFPANPCIIRVGAPITLFPGQEPNYLANNLDTCDCVVDGNNWVDFIKDDRILLSINSGGQNLGEVSVVAYVDSNPIDVQACASVNPLYTTTVMGRRYAVIPEFQPTNPIQVRVFFSKQEMDALILEANANVNPNDDFLWGNMTELYLGKYSNTLNPSVINGTFTDNCVSGAQSSMHMPMTNGEPKWLWPSFIDNSGRYVVYNVPTFSELWIHGNSNGNVSPLPVELTDFNAHCMQNEVVVKWTTASEINNQYFLLEKSTDMQDWEAIATIDGAGNSNEVLHYSYSDKRFESGLSYYRLTQFDFNGEYKEYPSQSVSCDRKENTPFTVYPNPASDVVFIQFADELKPEDIQSIELISMSGVQVSKSMLQFDKMNMRMQIPRNNLAAGVYVLRVNIAGEESEPLKIIFK